MEPVPVEEQEHGLFHRVETSSEIDAMVPECVISNSQEEVLRGVSWPSSHPHSHMPCSSSQQEFSSQGASAHAALNPTVGTHITEFRSPLETSCPSEEEEGNSQTDFEIDSFDPRFDSDRDRSPATQIDSVVMMGDPDFDSNQLTTGFQSSDKSLLQLQEVPSANLNNNANLTIPFPSKITSKTTSCRGILVDKEGQPETTLDNSPPNFAPDKFTSASQLLTQSEAIMDTQWLLRGGLLNYDLLTNFDQISSQMLPTVKSPQGLDMQTSPAATLAESREEAIAIEGSRAHRILPPSLAGPSVPRDSMTAVEIEKGPEQLKDALSKRRRRDPRPFPETLMDVIMHYSGDPPIGFEDVDIIQAAIKAGMTFPPPICRHSFPR